METPLRIPFSPTKLYQLESPYAAHLQEMRVKAFPEMNGEELRYAALHRPQIDVCLPKVQSKFIHRLPTYLDNEVQITEGYELVSWVEKSLSLNILSPQKSNIRKPHRGRRPSRSSCYHYA